MKPIPILIVIIASTLLFSCKKGDTGPAGPQGPQGIAGNANVTQYTYGAQNLSAGFVQLAVTTTKDTMDKSAWFVYLHYQALDRWYFLPGSGVGGNTQYRVSMNYITNKVMIYIDKSGPGENYDQAKVVRVYTSSQQTGGRSAPGQALPQNLDFTNYEAVRNYYRLP